MALPIKHPTTLTGKAAKRFNEIAESNYMYSKIPKEDWQIFSKSKETKKEQILQILSKAKL